MIVHVHQQNILRATPPASEKRYSSQEKEEEEKAKGHSRTAMENNRILSTVFGFFVHCPISHKTLFCLLLDLLCFPGQHPAFPRGLGTSLQRKSTSPATTIAGRVRKYTSARGRQLSTKKTRPARSQTKLASSWPRSRLFSFFVAEARINLEWSLYRGRTVAKGYW